MAKNDAGAAKAARSIFGSIDPRLRDPVGLFVRIWGVALLFFILYIHFFFNALGGEIVWIYAWLGAYLGFQLLTEILHHISPRSYDTTTFRLVRVLINIGLGTWLIAIAPNSRFLLGLFFAIPIFATIVYFKGKVWLQIAIFGLSILGLYLGGIYFSTGLPLTWPQLLSQIAALICLSVLLHKLYISAEVDSAGLAQTTRTLSETLDISKLAEYIITFSQQITSADRVFVLIIDPEKSRYVHHASLGYQLLKGRSVEQLVEKCSVLKSGVPFQSVDFQNEFQDGSIYQKFFGCQPRSILVEPIFSREKKVLGIINVSHDSPHKFNDIEKNQFRQFSYMVGSAIENSLLYRQALLDESSQREVSERLATTVSEEDVVAILVQEAMQLIHKADGCVFHRYDPVTKELHPEKASYVSAANLGKTIMQLGVGVAGHALALRESVLVSDLSTHPWFEISEQEVDFKALLVAPLIDPETREPIGTLSVHSHKTGTFDTEDEAELYSLAHQGAVAFSKIRAFARWRAHGGAIRRILDEFNRMDIKAGEQELSSQIALSAIRVLGFCIARIRLLDPKTGDLNTVAMEGIPYEEAMALMGQRMPWKAIEPYMVDKYKAERSYLIPHDLEDWKEVCNRYLYIPSFPKPKESGWREYDAFITPLITQSGEVLGLLSLDLPKSDTRPTAEVIEAVGVFASAATLTLELSRLWSRLREQRSRTMEFIGAIGRQLSVTRDLNTIGNVVVQVGAKLLSAEGCSLYLAKGGELELAYSNYLAGTRFIGRRKPISAQSGSGLTAWVASTGQELFYNDTSFRRHPAWAGDDDHLAHLPGGKCRSLLLVPVQLPGQGPCGVLKLENKKATVGREGFSEVDLENLRLLAHNVALAIDWIGRYEIIQKWERKGLEDDLHEVVNFYHSGVVLLIDHLTSLLANDDFEAAREVLLLIRHRAYTMVDELKAIHTAFRREYLESDRISKGMHLLVDAWIETISGLGISLPVSLDCPEDLDLPAPIMDAYLRIAAGALSNAIKHSGVKENPKGISIRIQVTRSDSIARLIVSDNGRGTSDITKKKGYGISRMEQLVAKLSASGFETTLQIDTSPDKGMTVTVISCLDGQLDQESSSLQITHQLTE